jgi:hypothetical protein
MWPGCLAADAGGSRSDRGGRPGNQISEEAIIVSTPTISGPLDHQRAASFRNLQLLAGAYLGLSAAALAAIIVISDVAGGLSATVWTRGIIVTIGAAALLAAAVRASRGSRRAWRRMRVVSAVLVASVVAVVSLPGFPLWMKAEQGVAGLCLVGIAVLASHAHLRSAFTAR